MEEREEVVWKWWYRHEDVEDLLKNWQETKKLWVCLPEHYLVMGHVFKVEEFRNEISASRRAKWIKRFVRGIQKDVWYASLADVFTIVGSLLGLRNKDDNKWSYDHVHSFHPLATAAMELGMSDDDVEIIRKSLNKFAENSQAQSLEWMSQVEFHGEFPTTLHHFFSRSLTQFGNRLQTLHIYVGGYWHRMIKGEFSSSFWEALCGAVASLPSLNTLVLENITMPADALAQLGNALASPTCMLQSLELAYAVVNIGHCFQYLISGNKLKTLRVWPSDEILMPHVYGLLDFNFDSKEFSNVEELEIKFLWNPENTFINWQFLAKLLQSPNQHLRKLAVCGNEGRYLPLRGYILRNEGRYLPLRGYILRRHDGNMGKMIELLTASIQSSNCVLTHLNIDVPLVPKKLEGLLDAVPRSKLEDLTLGYGIGRECGEELYVILGKLLQDPNCKLTSLKITGESVKDKFPDSFFKGLILSATLQSLELEDNQLQLGLEGQAELGDAIEKSRLTKLILMVRFAYHERLFEGILKSGIKSLEINLFNNLENDNNVNLEMTCRLLVDNPTCNIENIKLGVEEEDCKRILEVLDENFSSQLQKLTMYRGRAFTSWNSKAEQILERNRLLKRVTLTSYKQAEAGNLYICGSTGAGKTTITHNLTRKFDISFPACLQRHESTSGIELQPLSFPGTTKKLLIWDLAGQREFHAFHHSFLRGAQRSIFLLVLKFATDLNLELFEKDLVYWLRFISSHTTTSSLHRPKVIIVLNFFYSPPSDNIYVVELVKEKVVEYKVILDIDLTDIFLVKATKTSSLKALKKKLGKTTEALLSQHHKVPGLFQDAKKMCMQLRKSVKIKATDDLGDALLADQHNLSLEDKKDMTRFTFQYLHDIGEAVYIETTDLLSRNVILDVQWFVHDVISLFIDPEKIKWSSQHEKVQDMSQVAVMLQGRYGADKVDFIFGCLYEMGIILPMDEQWNGEWKPLPKNVTVPTLVKQKKLHFSHAEGCSHWGRRVECNDVKFKLFPPGIFAKIQARIHRECRNPSFNVGNGWVLFQDDRVYILVKVGGDTDSWMDRQWVDIMVMTKDSSKAEQFVKKLKMCIIEICFGQLEIGQEKVLGSKYVKEKMQGQEVAGMDSHAQEVVHVSYIENEAIHHGLNYWHTWCLGEDDSVARLLFPSEQEKCSRHRNKVLEGLCKDYESFVTEVYDSPALDSSIPSIPTDFKDGDSQKLATYMQDLTRWHEGRTGEKLTEITSKLESLAKQVHANTSRLLHSLKVDCPKYPLVVTEDNKFMRYVELVTCAVVKVQYMCEYERGGHHVRHAEGVTLTLPSDWLRRWSPVLIPSLIVLFTTAKVAATLTPGAAFMKEVLEESEKGMVEFLKANMNMESFDAIKLRKNLPTRKDIEEVFQAVQEQSGVTITELKTKTMMRRKFGLEWSTDCGAWLCDDHI